MRRHVGIKHVLKVVYNLCQNDPWCCIKALTTYLAQYGQVSDPALHEQAEQLEHAHELADEIDASLDYPQRDPHGEPIPHRSTAEGG